MKKLFLIFLILALESFFIYSQDNVGALNVPWPDRQVWPESPRAAQLRQVMMPTPGLLTGAVEFEIPIYTIETEGVSIPISLKYRSNGIKVDDITISHDGNRAVKVDNYGEGAKFEDMVGSPGLSGMTLTYDDAGRLRSDETRGIVRIDYNNDGLPTRVYFSDGHSQLDSYDGFGNRLSTGYYEAVTPVVAGKIPSRSRLVSTRYYYGDGTVCEGDSVVMTRFNGGYFDGNGEPYYELADYQGNITTVLNRAGEIVSHTGFYPYGQPWRRPGERQWLYGGKEWLGADGRDEYDFHGRRQYPHLGIFTTPDPHADSYHDLSPYAYCAGNPIMYIDPTGCDSIYVVIKNKLEGIGKTSGNDPNKYIVRGAKAEEIRQNTANGEEIAPMKNSEDTAVIPHDPKLADKIEKSIKDAKRSGKEHGGHKDSNGITVWDAGDGVKANGINSITPFKKGGIIIKSTLDDVSAYWHVHPFIPFENDSGKGTPSNGDMDTDINFREDNGFSGTAMVFGGKGSASVYYKNTIVTSLPVKTLINLMR